MKKPKIPVEILNSLIGIMRLHHEDTGQIPDGKLYADMVRWAMQNTPLKP